MKKYTHSKKRKIFLSIVIIITIGAILFVVNYQRKISTNDQENANELIDLDSEDPAATPVPVTAEDINNTSHDASALGGYNVLIADRGNNRIIEVTPDKKIVWQYDFNLPRLGFGADDAFFAENGKYITVNLEMYHLVQKIDFQMKKVVWSYGTAGVPSRKAGFLNRPDDAYQLPNGNIVTADIKNCRVIEIASDKKIVRQYGVTGVCKDAPGYLDSPNGDTPLPNGHLLISNIRSHKVIELDENWKEVFSLKVPLLYPSDPQQTKAGNILIADYVRPGKIIEISRSGKVVWQYYFPSGPQELNKPSLAIELPNGNIMTNDDINHRVIVIDKKTKKILWQYGVTGKPGNKPGQLNIPDGVDIIMRSASNIASLSSGPVLKIGQVSRHPKNYVNQSVTATGYVLLKQNGYAIFSDEATGSIGPYDLPVSGVGVDSLTLKGKYTLQGILKYKGLAASNHNLYHLETTNISAD